MKLTDLFWGNSFGLKFAAMIAKAYYGAARDNMSKEHFSQVIDMCNDLWKHPEYQNKDPFFKSSILENWASSLRQRAIIDYSIEDALESIKLRRMVVSLNIKESMAFARGNLANSLFTYFDLTSDISTLEEAIVLLRQAVEFFETGQSLDIPLPGFLKKVEGNAIDVSTNLAHILSVKYTSTKQISYLQESISIQEDCIQKAPKNDPDLWWYHLQLSNYFHEHFKYYNNKLSLNNAISNIKQAISLLEPNKTFYYGALNNLAAIQLSAYHQLREFSYLEEALQIAQRNSREKVNPDIQGLIYSVLAECEAEYADYKRDESAFQRSLTAYRQAMSIKNKNDTKDHYISLQYISIIYRWHRKEVHLVHYFDEAVQICRDTLQQLDQYFTMAITAFQIGRIDRYAALYRRALSLLSISSTAWPTQEDWLRELFILIEGNKAKLLTTQLGRSTLFLNPNVPPELNIAERTIVLELASLNSKVLANYNMAHTTGQSSDQRQIQIIQELDRLWDQIAVYDPQYVSMRRSLNPTWEQIQRLTQRLGPETLLITIKILEDKTILFLTRHGDSAPTLIENDGLTFDTWIDIVERLQRETRLARRETWHERVIPLIEELLPHLSNTSRIVLSADGPSQLLPWSALTQRAGWGGAVVQTPSLQWLSLSYHHPRVRQNSVLVVGNPQRKTHSNLADLPASEDEARAIAAHFGVHPLIGAYATKTAVLERLQHADMAHFACHVHFNANSPLDSGIVLANEEVLTAREILSHHISIPDFITLAACESGQAGTLAGDELIGLSQALLYIGARTVLASLWNVEDRSTAFLMTSFYQALQSQDRATALQTAMRETRSSNEAWQHSRFWSGFALLGLWDPPEHDTPIYQNVS